MPVDIGNVTEIFTKIILRNDVAETWENSTIVLERGEPALELDLETGYAKFKVGDGSHVFADLPYSTATPKEIQDMIDTAIANIEGGGGGTGTDGIYAVELSSGTNNGTLKLKVNNNTYDNIFVTGLGSAAFTDVSDYATAAQGAKADIAMAFKGIVDTLPTVGGIGDTYKVSAKIDIEADLSYTGEDVSASIGDIITLLNNGWLVVPCGAVAETAKALEEGISASVTGAVTGSAAAANAGETLNIEITSVNADYIIQGTKTIIFNGGSASN